MVGKHSIIDALLNVNWKLLSSGQLDDIMKRLFLLLTISFSNWLFAAENTLAIFGELQSKPCSIKPGDELIDMKIDTITDADLFSGVQAAGEQRTHIHKFNIHLEKCNPSVAKSLVVTMKGTPSPYDSSLLILSSGSMASGLGLGFTDRLGNKIKLGSSKTFPIKEENMAAELGVYMKLLSQKDFKIGAYNATANLELAYQ